MIVVKNETEATGDLDLLQRYARDRDEDGFSELVRRHLNLVYSAALRQVRSPQLAEEVVQSAFTDLATNAGRLIRGASSTDSLAPWLYQITRRSAIDVVRREGRRQLREQIAAEMNAINASTADWAHLEPLLDDAMATLDAADRAALLLRYFENKSPREVGRHLGLSDDTAQKRVGRAVERLREFFARRGVTIGASGLALVISANAVQAAPAGLAATISTAAALAGAALSATAAQAITMTTLQKTLVAGTIAVVAGAGIYEAQQASQLRKENQALQQQLAPLVKRTTVLATENENLAKKVADVKNQKPLPADKFTELLQLRNWARLNTAEIAELKSALAQQRERLPDYLITMLNGRIASAIENQRKIEETNANVRLAKLTETLGLNPGQQQQARDILFSNVQARAEIVIERLIGADPYEEIRKQKQQVAAGEDQALASVLTANQMAAHGQMTSADDEANYQAWAQREASRLVPLLNLATEQEGQVASVLHSLKLGEGGESIPWYSNAMDQLDIRMGALVFSQPRTATTVSPNVAGRY
jgi:RNA polymerase sigma factor (sigma-70 family)